MSVKPFALGHIGGLAHGTVGALLVHAQLGQCEVLAVKMHHKAGVQLLVFAYQAVFLLLQGQHAVIAGAHSQIHLGQKDLAVFFGQCAAEGAFQQSAVQRQLGVAHGGIGFVKMLALGGVKGIAGINGVANAGKACHKAVVGVQLDMLGKHIRDLAGRAGGLHALGQRGIGSQNSAGIRAGIHKFRKFHSRFSYIKMK